MESGQTPFADQGVYAELVNVENVGDVPEQHWLDRASQQNQLGVVTGLGAAVTDPPVAGERQTNMVILNWLDVALTFESL